MLDLHGMLERVDSLLLATNTQKKELAKDIGISVAAFSDWRRGKARPNIETVVNIAEYFHVSIDYLVYGTSADSIYNNSDLSAIAITKFSSLNTFNQIMAAAYIDGLLASQHGANNNGV